jgi:hypothetical protein
MLEVKNTGGDGGWTRADRSRNKRSDTASHLTALHIDIPHRMHPSAGSYRLVVKMANHSAVLEYLPSLFGGIGRVFQIVPSIPFPRGGLGTKYFLFFAGVCVRSVWAGLSCCESGGFACAAVGRTMEPRLACLLFFFFFFPSFCISDKTRDCIIPFVHSFL